MASSATQAEQRLLPPVSTAALPVHCVGLQAATLTACVHPNQSIVAEVVRSADLVSYTAEEGLRYFGEVRWLVCSCTEPITLGCMPYTAGEGVRQFGEAPKPLCTSGQVKSRIAAVSESCPVLRAWLNRCLAAPPLQGKLLASDSFPGQDRSKLCMASKVPLGVVLAIPPFNYPVNLAVRWGND